MRGRLILDCSQLLPGPQAAKHLLRLGARVIKIENPKRPDPALELAHGAYYRDTNEGKEILSLDLTREDHQTQFRALLTQADALIEAYLPKTKAKLGLLAETLQAINPRLVVLSLTGFSSGSKYENDPSHDLNLLALTGALSLCRGIPDFSLSDQIAGLEAALAVAAACDEVSRGMPAKVIPLSITQCLLRFQSKWFREFEETGRIPSPGDTVMSGAHPCYQIYQTKDQKKIAVAALEEHYWSAFCRILELPQLVPHRLAIGVPAKTAMEAIQNQLMTKTRAEWMTLIGANPCCVTPVLSYSEVEKNGL